ncbi:MAG: DNA-binding protein [Actinomycetota bacterium]|nr:DNA-binding protein [Actinomycetota bacterium]
MKSKLLHESADRLRTYAVVFGKGDEVKSGLERFARDRRITGASLTGIGAFREGTLAYFDPDELDYLELPVNEQVGVLSLVGNVTLEGGEPTVHVHVVVGKRDGTTAGGHLKAATVWPTLEVIIEETPRHLRRRYDRETGLTVIDLSH